jgi:hypothetical protein
VPIGIPVDCFKTWSPKCTYILSIRKLSIPKLSALEYLCGLSKWCLTKYVSCFPIIRNLYFQVPFLIDRSIIVLRPAKEFFTCIETSPLPVKVCKFSPMLGAQGLCAGRDVYRATPAVTQGLSFFRSHPKDRPILSPLKTHNGVLRIYSNPVPFFV